MHDALFDSAPGAGPIDWPPLVRKVGLDPAKFDACVVGGAKSLEEVINHSRELAVGFGIQATPTFLIGRREPTELVRPLTLIRGVRAFNQFKVTIDAAIAGNS